MRAILTADGFLLLEVREHEWSDGDLHFHGTCESDTLIEDVERDRPDLAERASVIAALIG